MKPLILSFIVGLLVGVAYGLIRVKSPAPPIIALLGLLGMVIGEQCGTWAIAKKVNLVHAASVCLVGKHWDQRSDVAHAAVSSATTGAVQNRDGR